MLSVKVINLDRSPQRLASVIPEIKKMGFDAQRFSAFDMAGKTVFDHPNYDSASARYGFGAEMSPGEIGCYQSHITILEEFLASSDEYLLVFEDDVVANEDISSLISTMMAANNDGTCPFYVANLSATHKKRRIRALMIGEHQLWRNFYFPTLTSALFWSRKGAIEFLENFEARNIDAAIDQKIRKFAARYGGGVSFDPPIVALAEVESDIDNIAVRVAQATNPIGIKIAKIRRNTKNYLWSYWNLAKFCICGWCGWGNTRKASKR